MPLRAEIGDEAIQFMRLRLSRRPAPAAGGRQDPAPSQPVCDLRDAGAQARGPGGGIGRDGIEECLLFREPWRDRDLAGIGPPGGELRDLLEPFGRGHVALFQIARKCSDVGTAQWAALRAALVRMMRCQQIQSAISGTSSGQ